MRSGALTYPPDRCRKVATICLVCCIRPGVLTDWLNHGRMPAQICHLYCFRPGVQAGLSSCCFLALRDGQAHCCQPVFPAALTQCCRSIARIYPIRCYLPDELICLPHCHDQSLLQDRPVCCASAYQLFCLSCRTSACFPFHLLCCVWNREACRQVFFPAAIRRRKQHRAQTTIRNHPRIRIPAVLIHSVC